ncbi:hypothetical protein JHK84_047576 [Glycine max]|nr:hypothetical protein JHK84_047576 [Glycine max]
MDGPGAGKHIQAGAKKVIIITAPAKGVDIPTYVVGVPKEVDLMESRLNTAIGDCSETKVAREGTKRKKKTQTWIEPLPHKEEKKQSGHEGRVKGS